MCVEVSKYVHCTCHRRRNIITKWIVIISLISLQGTHSDRRTTLGTRAYTAQHMHTFASEMCMCIVCARPRANTCTAAPISNSFSARGHRRLKARRSRETETESQNQSQSEKEREREREVGVSKTRHGWQAQAGRHRMSSRVQPDADARVRVKDCSGDSPRRREGSGVQNKRRAFGRTRVLRPAVMAQIYPQINQCVYEL